MPIHKKSSMNHQWITTSNGLLIVATEVSTFALSIQGPSFLHRNKMDRRCWSAQSSGGGANGWSIHGWMDGKTGETNKNAMRCLEGWKFGLWKFRSISLRLHNLCDNFTLVEQKVIRKSSQMSFRFSGLNREKCCGGAIGMNISNAGEDWLV